MSDEMFLHIERESLVFTRAKGKDLETHYEGGVILLTRKTLDDGFQPRNVFKATFQTTSGAVVAEGEYVTKGYYAKEDEEDSFQRAVTNMSEKLQLEVDRFRLLMRLATR